MPFVKINTNVSLTKGDKIKLVHAVKEIVPLELKIDKKVVQVILLDLDIGDASKGQGEDFVWVEVTMYRGRSLQIKQGLALAIIAEIKKYMNLDPKDINLVYYEVDKENFFSGQPD